MKISCSARKDWHYHIKDWIDFQRYHAKIHSTFEFTYDEIDYAFGQVEGNSKLWGGRVFDGVNLTKVDTYWLYDKGIGVKLTLSNKLFTEFDYKASKDFLEFYHREGNAIIVANDELAKRLKEDFPKYELEASCILDTEDTTTLQKRISIGYDIIVLPIHMNDDFEFLKSIENKKQIRLFMNAECSYTCPLKVCYGSTSRINSGRLERGNMKCSYYDLKMPRTFYKDDINWSDFYFDKPKYDELGFERYKLVPSWESQQRTHLMYEKNAHERV